LFLYNNPIYDEYKKYNHNFKLIKEHFDILQIIEKIQQL